MNIAVIACEVMRYELEMICVGMEKAPRLYFLRQGLHDTPKRLKEELQAKIDDVEGSEPGLTHLVLGYGLCGQGLTGIQAQRCELVVPRVHDCIPLLLGSVEAHREEQKRDCGTYWFSPGWLTWSVIPYLDNRTNRLARYVDKYGKQRADMLMQMEESVLSNYNRACLIEWPELGRHYRGQAEGAASRSNLQLQTIKGSSEYLTALLSESWDEKRFVHIRPGQTLIQSMDDQTVMNVKGAEEQAA